MLRSKQNASLLPPLRSCLSFPLRDYTTTGLDQQTLQPLSQAIGLDVGGERASATRNAALLSG